MFIKFFNWLEKTAVYEYLELIGRARTASQLTRMGKIKQAQRIMLEQ